MQTGIITVLASEYRLENSVTVWAEGVHGQYTQSVFALSFDSLLRFSYGMSLYMKACGGLESETQGVKLFTRTQKVN